MERVLDLWEVAPEFQDFDPVFLSIMFDISGVKRKGVCDQSDALATYIRTIFNFSLHSFRILSKLRDRGYTLQLLDSFTPKNLRSELESIGIRLGPRVLIVTTIHMWCKINHKGWRADILFSEWKSACHSL
jgi:hypothetical protein